MVFINTIKVGQASQGPALANAIPDPQPSFLGVPRALSRSRPATPPRFSRMSRFS